MYNIFNREYVIDILNAELKGIQYNIGLIIQSEKCCKDNDKNSLRLKELKHYCNRYLLSVKKAIQIAVLTPDVKQSRKAFYDLKYQVDRLLLPKSCFTVKANDTEKITEKITKQDIEILQAITASH